MSLNNEERAEVLIKRYDFDFSLKYHEEIRQLLETEIIRYQNGSSEYLRFLCGYLFCINDYKDASDITSHIDEVEKFKDNFCYIKMDIENSQTICYCESEGVPYDLFKGSSNEI